MTAQLTLPFVVHSDTSRRAAESIPVKKVATDRLRILRAIASAGTDGLTDEQGYSATQIPPNTYRPRRGEIYEVGLIKPISKRPAKSGRLAVAWAATQKGLECV